MQEGVSEGLSAYLYGLSAPFYGLLRQNPSKLQQPCGLFMIVVSEAVTDSHEEPVCSLSAIPSHPLRPPNSTPGLSMLHSDTWARGPAGQWASGPAQGLSWGRGSPVVP